MHGLIKLSISHSEQIFVTPTLKKHFESFTTNSLKFLLFFVIKRKITNFVPTVGFINLSFVYGYEKSTFSKSSEARNHVQKFERGRKLSLYADRMR